MSIQVDNTAVNKFEPDSLANASAVLKADNDSYTFLNENIKFGEESGVDDLRKTTVAILKTLFQKASAQNEKYKSVNIDENGKVTVIRDGNEVTVDGDTIFQEKAELLNLLSMRKDVVKVQKHAALMYVQYMVTTLCDAIGDILYGEFEGDKSQKFKEIMVNAITEIRYVQKHPIPPVVAEGNAAKAAAEQAAAKAAAEQAARNAAKAARNAAQAAVSPPAPTDEHRHRLYEYTKAFPIVRALRAQAPA